MKKKFRGLEEILLVDDDIPTNFVHRKVIERSDVEVEVKAVNSARDALDFLTKSGKYAGEDVVVKPGLIFLDINMPAMSGWDFMEYYHKLDPRFKAHIIVIMLTTSLNPSDEQKARKDFEIADFLHKPLRTETLEKIVQKYFRAAH
jgi:CheY-like chemotaxis protein